MVAAVAAATGELVGEQKSVLLGWAARVRGAGAVGAAVSMTSGCGRWRIAGTCPGSLERFLIERGERVLRIPTHLTAKARKSARRRQV